MDVFLEICQGLGLGIAAGAVVGSVGREGPAATALIVFAAVLGAAAGGVWASTGEDPVAAGAAGGALGGGLAAAVLSGVVAGARRRDAEGGALSALVLLGAAVIAVAAILLEPLALVPFAGLLYLGAARRRRSQRKHAGLRILR
jgi:hypothetical protein